MKPSRSAPGLPPLTRLALVALGAVVALFGFLPLADWIPGGWENVKYATISSEWLNGSLIAIGGGLLVAILSRHLEFLWRPGAADGLIRQWHGAPVPFALGIALTALAMYLVVAVFVLSARPLLIDEIVQVLQAEMFANGRLWVPTSPFPEFFSSMHVVDLGDRVFSQFPPGGPLMLTPGVILGAPWVVGPVAGALAVLAFAAYVRITEPRAGVALGALLLLAFAPLMMFMAGSHMNHTFALLWVLVAMAAMARVMTSSVPRPLFGFLSGLGFGIAATIRPVDAFAFALPGGCWFLYLALRDRRRWADTLASGVGVALPVLGMLWFNQETTGSPFLFGYKLLWGDRVDLGFHDAPWGEPHTVARGVEVINVYLVALQSRLFETPLPSLVAAIGAVALTRRLDRFDRYLLASSTLLMALYFAYWHNGEYLGPRFAFCLLPALAIWTARFLPIVRERVGDVMPYRATVYAFGLSVVIAAIVGFPLRARQHASILTTMRWDADRAAAEAGVRDALVFVRESWGAQVMTRLWAMGIPRPEAERLYRATDTCLLDSAMRPLEARGIGGLDALARLTPLLVNSPNVVNSTLSADRTEVVLPGLEYTPHCRQRIAEDNAGYTLFPPLLLARGGNNLYVRDLHERNVVMLREHPGRPVYLLRPLSTDVGSPPRFIPLPRDSVLRAWSEHRASPEPALALSSPRPTRRGQR